MLLIEREVIREMTETTDVEDRERETIEDERDKR